MAIELTDEQIDAAVQDFDAKMAEIRAQDRQELVSQLRIRLEDGIQTRGFRIEPNRGYGSVRTFFDTRVSLRGCLVGINWNDDMTVSRYKNRVPAGWAVPYPPNEQQEQTRNVGG